MVVGLALNVTSYSNSPILEVPDGSTRFWVVTALTMSLGESPWLAASAAQDRS